LTPPKSISSVRRIAVDPIVTKALLEQRNRLNVLKMKNRKTYHDADFIFVHEHEMIGFPFTTKFVSDRMRRIIKQAGLSESFTPHTLRHTQTSLLAQIGVSIDVIMNRLGHQNDDVTRRIYLHVTDHSKKEAVTRFSSFMNMNS
jgi:integrase